MFKPLILRSSIRRETSMVSDSGMVPYLWALARIDCAGLARQHGLGNGVFVQVSHIAFIASEVW